MFSIHERIVSPGGSVEFFLETFGWANRLERSEPVEGQSQQAQKEGKA